MSQNTVTQDQHFRMPREHVLWHLDSRLIDFLSHDMQKGLQLWCMFNNTTDNLDASDCSLGHIYFTQ
jgi:hypothetical protein